MKERMVVTTIINADMDTSSLNLAAIKRDNTIVGIAPSMRHEERASPLRPSR